MSVPAPVWAVFKDVEADGEDELAHGCHREQPPPRCVVVNPPGGWLRSDPYRVGKSVRLPMLSEDRCLTRKKMRHEKCSSGRDRYCSSAIADVGGHNRFGQDEVLTGEACQLAKRVDRTWAVVKQTATMHHVELTHFSYQTWVIDARRYTAAARDAHARAPLLESRPERALRSGDVQHCRAGRVTIVLVRKATKAEGQARIHPAMFSTKESQILTDPPDIGLRSGEFVPESL